MTKEEAIELLYDIQTDAVYNILPSEKEAIDMAIEVLEQEAVLDKIRAEIDGIEISGQIDEHSSFIKSGNEVKNIALNIIDKYKSESEEENE